jgi:hypothetical protein
VQGKVTASPGNPEYNVRRIVMMLDSTGGAIVEVQPVLQAFKFPDLTDTRRRDETAPALDVDLSGITSTFGSAASSSERG